MLTVLVDTNSGNLHSALKAFERCAPHAGDRIRITSDPDEVAAADHVVLPGDGAFPASARALMDDRAALHEAILEAVETRGRPFLGICVGMQLMARRGHEFEGANGLGWIDAEVVPITPRGEGLKVPHMGWNDLVVTEPHPVLEGIETGDHAYFIHSFHMEMSRPDQRLAHTHHGGAITAVVASGNRIGTQFHPEKSQEAGLRLITNFLTWRP